MTARRQLALAIATASIILGACGSASPAASSGQSVGPPASAPPSSSPITSSAPEATPAFHVVGLELRADPAAHVGACPVLITFTATIEADRSGSATYRWLSSDGDASPPKTIDFARPGPLEVSSTWRVNPADTPTHAGWSSIELVNTPSTLADHRTSARAEFAFTCDSDDDVEAIGFGLGGSDADCSIAKPLRTFASKDPIRMVANWWPSLATGTVVTIRLTRDGELIQGYPVTTTFHEPTRCVHGNVSPGFLPAGHYRLDVAPDTARAVSGEFDVK